MPTNRYAYMFPGQGSQFRGMGNRLFAQFSQHTDIACEILGYDLRDLCLRDPQNSLSLTQFTQPAIYVVSALTYLQYIERQNGQPCAVLGHSLGEFSALFAAGAFDFAAGLRLVKKRSEIMARVTDGAMAAVMGLSEEFVRDILNNTNIDDVQLANINSDQQIVLSGKKARIIELESKMTCAGARAYVHLNVSGAFHSHMMESASAEFKDHLQCQSFNSLSIPVVANVTANFYQESDLVSLLSRQLTSPVRWLQSIHLLQGLGVKQFHEIGPGKVLSNLITNITPATALSDQAQVFQRTPSVSTTLRGLVADIKPESLDKIAFIERSGRDFKEISYAYLQSSIRKMGARLGKCGVAKGQAVAIYAENRWEWAASYCAVTTIGAIAVPMDVFMGQNDLATVLCESRVKAVITSNSFSERIIGLRESHAVNALVFNMDELNDLTNGVIAFNTESPALQGIDLKIYDACTVEENDTAVLIHLTGSRFAALSHGNIVANVIATKATLSESGKFLQPGEISLACVPFHHTFPTVGGFLLPLASAMTVAILPRFSSVQFVKVAQRLKANYAVAVPFMLDKILEYLEREKVELPEFRFIFAGGAPIHKDTMEALDKLGLATVQGYGLTECSPVVTVNTPSNNHYGSIGLPIEGVTIEIRDTDHSGNGELWVKSPSIMQGYINAPELNNRTLQEGWLRTGDIVKQAENGFLYVTGRSRSIVVNQGGKNIYTDEVENLIRASKYVVDVRIKPYLCPREGEVPAAYVSVDSEAISDLEIECEKTFTSEEIKALITAKIERLLADVSLYKHPQIIFVVPDVFALESSGSHPDGNNNVKFMFDDHYQIPRTESSSRIPSVATVSSREELSKNELQIGDKIQAYLISKLQTYIKLPTERLRQIDLQEAGLDSLSMLNIKFEIERDIKTQLPIRLLGTCPTVQAMTNSLLTEIVYQPIMQRIVDLAESKPDIGESASELNVIYKNFVQKKVNPHDLDSRWLVPLFELMVDKTDVDVNRLLEIAG